MWTGPRTQRSMPRAFRPDDWRYVDEQVARAVWRPEQTSSLDTILGLDLGKTRDPSALVWLDKRQHDTPGGAWRRVQLECRSSKRYPLNTEYPTVMADVQRVCLMPDEPPTLVVDASGVGAGVVDYVRRSHPRCKLVPVVITGGMNARWHEQTRAWRVSKQLLVGTAKVALQEGVLLFAEGLSDLVAELSGYRVEVTKSANEVYSARENEHDDLVMALCVAVWWAMYRGQRMNVL
jgi:hypothetical protein